MRAAESEVPPRALVEGCLAAYERSRDARFLPPALAGLPGRADALALLPKLLTLDAGGLKAAVHRLMLPQPETGALKCGSIMHRNAPPTCPCGHNCAWMCLACICLRCM